MKIEKDKFIKLPDEIYFAQEDCASSSVLKTLYRKSAKHLLGKKKETKPMEFGKGFHHLLLECDTFFENYAIIPDFQPSDGGKKSVRFTATNDYKDQKKEWEKEIAHKIPVKPEDYERMQLMKEAVYSTDFGKDLLSGGHSEMALFTKMDGVDCKIKVDYVKEFEDKIVAIDVKTCEDASEQAVRKAVYWGNGCIGDYNIQSSFYPDVITNATGKPVVWIWMFIEKGEDPQACWYEQTQEAYENGVEKYKKALATFQKVKFTGCYTGYDASEQIIKI
jgi:hypothetical protein